MASVPCAACKHLGQECTYDCVFAPYFPIDQIEKFVNVDKVYGTRDVGKFLSELNPSERRQAANNLVLLANATLEDPIFGRAKFYSNLLLQVKELWKELSRKNIKVKALRAELSRRNIGQSAMLPIGSRPVNPAQIQYSHNSPLVICQPLQQLLINGESNKSAEGVDGFTAKS